MLRCPAVRPTLGDLECQRRRSRADRRPRRVRGTGGGEAHGDRGVMRRWGRCPQAERRTETSSGLGEREVEGAGPGARLAVVVDEHRPGPRAGQRRTRRWWRATHRPTCPRGRKKSISGASVPRQRGQRGRVGLTRLSRRSRSRPRRPRSGTEPPTLAPPAETAVQCLGPGHPLDVEDEGTLGLTRFRVQDEGLRTRRCERALERPCSSRTAATRWVTSRGRDGDGETPGRFPCSGRRGSRPTTP